MRTTENQQELFITEWNGKHTTYCNGQLDSSSPFATAAIVHEFLSLQSFRAENNSPPSRPLVTDPAKDNKRDQCQQASPTRIQIQNSAIPVTAVIYVLRQTIFSPSANQCAWLIPCLSPGLHSN